jgi:hypothetical protein
MIRWRCLDAPERTIQIVVATTPQDQLWRS